MYANTTETTRANNIPTTTAPNPSRPAAEARRLPSGSRYSGVGRTETRTSGRWPLVAGLSRQIDHNATAANDATIVARVTTSIVVTEMRETMDDTTTATTSVPLPPPTVAANRHRHLWWALPLLTIAWLVLLAVIVSSTVRLRLWETAPGSAEGVSSRLEFDDAARAQVSFYPATNPVLFVTAYGNRLSALDAFAGWIDDDVLVQTYEDRFGNITPSEQRRLGFQSMATSKRIAEYVAFNRLGLDVEIVFGEIIVEELVCEEQPSPSSACEMLDLGDTLVSFDGTKVESLDQLSGLLASRKPGDVVTLGIIPHMKTKVEERRIELIASPDDPTRTIIGLIPADTRTVNLPFEVNIDTDSIGGPSAGLAFTLALLDELTPGSLTGEMKVVATGTMSEDESVGAIGALRQKAVAAKRAGAKVFLVPASQLPEEIAAARAVGGDVMKIVTVANLGEALGALEKLGGSGITNATINL